MTNATPNPDPSAPEPWGWATGHRIALGALLFLLLCFMAVGYLRNAARLSDPVVVEHGAAVQLQTRIDPNTADEASLSRVPHLGPKLAAAVVAYRQKHQGEAGDGVVFASLADLDRVPGIGKKTLEQIRPYLSLPEGGPSANGLVPPQLVPETGPGVP